MLEIWCSLKADYLRKMKDILLFLRKENCFFLLGDRFCLTKHQKWKRERCRTKSVEWQNDWRSLHYPSETKKEGMKNLPKKSPCFLIRFYVAKNRNKKIKYLPRQSMRFFASAFYVEKNTVKPVCLQRPLLAAVGTLLLLRNSSTLGKKLESGPKNGGFCRQVVVVWGFTVYD